MTTQLRLPCVKRSRVVALALAVIVAALIVAVGQAGAALEQRAAHKRQQLEKARGSAGVLTTTIASYGDSIASLEGRTAELRSREAAVQQRLVVKQRELDQAASRLGRQQRHLAVLKARLRRALAVLSQRVVEIYKSGSPDMLTVVLDSKGWDDVVSRSEYLSAIQNQGQTAAERVRDVRDETKTLVVQLRAVRDQIRAARNVIATQKGKLVSARTTLEARQQQLVAVRDRRQSALDEVRAHERVLEGDLADLQAKIQQQLAAPPSAPVSSGSPSSSGMVWPINGTLTSTFGTRWGRMHEGIDIAAPTGTPIVAADSGTVVLAAYTGGYGNYTCIDHGGGMSTCYGHQNAFATSAGASVTQGEVIGYVGSTGDSTGPHLHFEVRISGIAQDPLGYL